MESSPEREQTRPNTQPDPGVPEDLGRHIYARHLRMSSVAGASWGLWRANQIHAFSATRLPMLADLQRKWSASGALPAPWKPLGYEWYVGRTPPQQVRTRLSIASQSTAPSPAPLQPSPSGPVDSTRDLPQDKIGDVAAPEAHGLVPTVETPSLRNAEWGPPILRTRAGGRSLIQQRDGSVARDSKAATHEAQAVRQARTHRDGATKEVAPTQQGEDSLQETPKVVETVRSSRAASLQDVPVHVKEPKHKSSVPSQTSVPRRTAEETTSKAEHPAETPYGMGSSNPVVPVQSNMASLQEPAPVLPATPVRPVTEDSVVQSIIRHRISPSPAEGTGRIARQRSENGKGTKTIATGHGIPLALRPEESEEVPHAARVPAADRVDAGIHASRPSASEFSGVENGAPVYLSPSTQSEDRGDTTRTVSSLSVEGEDRKSHIELPPRSPSPQATAVEQIHVKDRVAVRALDVSAAAGKNLSARSVKDRGAVLPSPQVLQIEPLVVAESGKNSETAPTRVLRSLDRTAPSVDAVARKAELQPPSSGAIVPARSSEATPVVFPEASALTESGKSMNSNEDGPAISREPSLPVQQASTAAAPALDVAMVHAEVVQRVEVSSRDQSNIVPVFRRATPEEHTFPRPRDGSGSSSQASRPVSDQETVRQLGVNAGSTFQLQPGVRPVRPTPLLPRTAVTEIHRLSVSSKLAPFHAGGGGDISTALLQRQAVSPYSATVPSRRMGNVATTPDRTHVRPTPAAASEEPDTYEASVPIPSPSAAPPADSVSTLDVGQLADRVYHLLVNRLASERSRRGM